MGMSVKDALYHTVHDYDGGAEALAQRLGKRGTSLSHEVRPPANSTAKAGLEDAMRIIEISGDYRVLHAINARLGHMAVQLPVLDAEHTDTADSVNAMVKEFSDVLQVVALGGADHVITDRELADLQRQAGELIAAVNGMLAGWVSKNAAGKVRTAGDADAAAR